MKRIICILIILSMLLLASCNRKSPQETFTESNEMETLLKQANALKGEYTGFPVTTSAHHLCGAFDEYGIDHVTDIVKAKYEETWYASPCYVHKFRIVENLRGKGNEKTIYVVDTVIGSTKDTPEETFDLKYIKDKGYLLFLRREIDPFMMSDLFTPAYKGLYIPLHEDGKVGIDNATLCKTSLKEQITNEEIKQAISEDKFVEYFVSATKDNEERKNSYGISESTDISRIIEESSYVVKITVQKLSGNSIAQEMLPFYQAEYICTVQKCYKGDLKEVTELEVYLPKYRIYQGETYIIALKNFCGKNIPSSRNSIYRVEAEENVKALLSELEK